jgi:hypothetical protein
VIPVFARVAGVVLVIVRHGGPPWVE